MNPVDQYLSQLNEAQQQALQELRFYIKSIVPDAEETISYQMPMFKWHGMLVGFGAYKKHLSFFPCASSFSPELKKEIQPYLVGKSALHFTPDKPLPKKVIRMVIEERMRDNAAKMLAKKKK